MISSRFAHKLIRALEDEETDIFALSLYFLNTDDLHCFRKKDRERVKRIFKILVKDTQRHADLLRRIVDKETR